MKNAKRTIISTLWFIVEVIGIFVLVQAVRYAFGNWGALSIGLSLLGIALILFAAAYLSAKFKDKRDGKKPSHKAFTGILS